MYVVVLIKHLKCLKRQLQMKVGMECIEQEREHPIKGGHNLKLDLKSGCFVKAVAFFN